MKKLRLETILWGLYAVVSGLAVYVWGVQLDWSLNNIDALTIFPLFGLLAFSLIWVHYVSGVIRDWWYPGESTKRSFAITSYVVLALILLHPSLMVIGLVQQGSGLPPESFKTYVGPGKIVYILLAELALIGFLLFEARRWLKGKNWHRYISIINDLAVLAIIVHSFSLGQHLQAGWFRVVWYFYTLTIIAFLIRTYTAKLRRLHSNK